MRSYVEHANMSVVDTQKTIHFLISADAHLRNDYTQ